MDKRAKNDDGKVLYNDVDDSGLFSMISTGNDWKSDAEILKCSQEFYSFW